jgi:DNA-binding FrmR family transcriptional regulator
VHSSRSYVRELIKRLHYIKGHIEGVEKMIKADRGEKEVYQQLTAIERALHSTIHQVFDEQLKKHFAELLVKRRELCPDTCAECARLDAFRTNFPNLKLQDVIQELSRLRSSEKKTRVKK